MKNMKRYFTAFILLVLAVICISVASACTGKNPDGVSYSQSGYDESSPSADGEQSDTVQSGSAEDTAETSAHSHILIYKEQTQATCTTDGNTAYWQCTECGMCFSDSEGTKNISLSDTVIKATGHTESGWIVTKEANCSEAGSAHKICNECGEELETLTYTSAAHVYGEWEVTKEPTCTEDGERHVLCIKCGEELKTETIPKAEHTAGDWVVTKEPSCTEEGEKQATCTLCGEIAATAAISKTEHNFAWEVTKEATCTEEGSEHFICTECRTEYKVQTIKANGHTPGEWIITQKPTCSQYGSMYRECTSCGEVTDQSVISMLAHTPDGYTSDRYYHYSTCSGCDESLSSLHTFEGNSCSVCGYTADYSVGLQYFLSDRGTEYYVTGIGSCTDTDIVIPDEYLGKPVTAITGRAFYDNQDITSVTIPASIETIGFVSQTYMNTVFQRCTSLTAVYITDLAAWCNIDFTVRTNNPLYYAGNLYLDGKIVNDIAIPGGITEIKAHTFAGCLSLTGVTLNENIRQIGKYSFYGCENLTQINDCGYITDIGEYAFGYCSSLGKIDMASLSSAGKAAFCECVSLTDVTIPGSLTVLGDGLFYGCKMLGNISLHAGITSIGSYAFYGCSALTAVSIPEKVTYIGGHAFACTSVVQIEVPAGVTALGDYVFCKCYSLEKAVLYTASVPEGTFEGCKMLESVIIDNVNYIGDYAFSGCASLESISMPDGVTYLGMRAFAYCYNLKEITIPVGVTEIYHGTFLGCTSLAKVIIPASVASLDEYAFYGCTLLTDIYFGGTEENWQALTDGFTDGVLDGVNITYSYQN